MSEQEHEKLINAIKRKRVTEEDKERFCISDSGAGIYNLALDHVIDVIEEMFKGKNETDSIFTDPNRNTRTDKL